MSGPWDDFKAPAQEQGPWNDYAAKEKLKTSPEDLKANEQHWYSGIGDLDQWKRSGANATRSVAQGLAGIPDIILGPLNYVTGGRTGTASQVADIGLNAAGIPQADIRSPLESGVSRIESGLGGVVGGMGLGSILGGSSGALTSNIGRQLVQAPAAQAASATSGAVASQLAQNAGAGPVGQALAGIAGGFAPSVPNLASMATKNALRGSESNIPALMEQAKNFQDLGISPTVGQVAGTDRARALESVLAKTPGAGSVMRNAADVQAQQASKAITGIADRLAPEADPARAGRSIERGITGEGGFMDQFKQNASKLYDRLDEYIPKTSRVSIDNTLNRLSELNQSIPGAPSTSRLFQNARMEGIKSGLESDVRSSSAAKTRPGIASKVEDLQEKLKANDDAITRQNVIRQSLGQRPLQPLGQTGTGKAVETMLGQMVDNKLPYESLKKLRTLVGGELENASIVSDVPKSKWKALYASLSQDMKNAAEQSGPEAKNAYSRANAYYNAGVSRIEDLSRVLDKHGGPEAVYNAATSGTKNGATTLRTVMQSLPKDAQATVASTIVRRLGTSTPGAQNASGDAFSMNTFLTNWNRLSPSARNVMMDRFGPQFRQNMESLSKVASNVREGSKYLANPSGTSSAGAGMGALSGFAASLASGHPAVAAGIAGGAGIANLAGRAMTNPNVVNWLSTVNQPIPSQVGNISNNSPTMNYLRMISAQRNQQ